MSFSFPVRAASKAEAKQAVEAKMAEVANSQKCHARDQAQVLAAANAFIDLLVDDESKDVVVNVGGSLTGQWEGTDVTRIESAQVSVYAYLATREQAAQ